MTMPFDTLKYARELEAAGVPWEQAQSQATLLAHALSSRTACSEHLARVNSNLENRLESSALRIENAFIPLFNSLNVLKWMHGVVLGLTIAIFLKLLFH